MKRLIIALGVMFALSSQHCNAQKSYGNSGVQKQLTYAAQSIESQNDKIVIVDEDFSALTAGTEDAFDPVPLEDSKGWVSDELMKPYDDACTRPWGGMGLYSAGGAIAVSNGFLNTPTGDYSGTLKMTCRVRLAKGQKITDFEGNELANPQLELILLRRSLFVDYKRVKIDLTEEWQNITFEADNGWFSDCMIQFFTMYDMTFLVDDVRIEHVITSIEYPHATDAENVSDSSFVAHWNPTDTAEEYLLSVYTKHDNPESDVEDGDFETINTTDGKMINLSDPRYPEGWEINVTDNGSDRNIFTEEGMYQSGKQSLCLDADGDYIQTRMAKDPIKQAHFWINVDDTAMPADQQSESSLAVQVYNGVQWFDLFFVSVEAARQLGEGVVVDCAEYLGLVNKVLQMRILLNKDEADRCLVAIDDFGFTAPGQPIKDYFFRDKALPRENGTSLLVTVPDPNAEYFYYLRARNSEFTSAEGNEVEVFDVHEPVALPATDITENSYTANWKCGPKSDYFTVNQFLRYTAAEDVKEYVVLEEDFSKVISDADPSAPETGELATDYLSLDKYTKIPGWRAGSYALADGMLGGIEADYEYKIGSVILPKINLSNNNGVCYVTIRAYGQKGDWLIIGGNSQITVGAMEFLETGLSEATFTLEGCSADEEFEIYTQNYGTFLIDYIKITQPLEEGNEVTILTKSQQTDNADDRSVSFTDAPFTEGLDLCYNVIAHRLYHGSTEEIWRSHDSNMVAVDSSDTGIETLSYQLPLGIRMADGGIDVTVTESTDVRIYDFSGSMLKSQHLTPGSNFVQLARGAYIVSVGGTGKAKVYVR